ncbi:hypothetical protein ACROYT_G011520 [Oculina patagonica]
MFDDINYHADTQPRRDVKHVFLVKCRRSPFLSRANAEKPDHIRMNTVMNVARCKWNQKIMKLNTLVEDDFKVLRSDNGGEYTSNNFVKFCAEKETSLEFTVPYCPQQDGADERMNLTIMEGARLMLYQAKLALEFSAEACSTAPYFTTEAPQQH